MFKSVTVTNDRGESLELPLAWPNDAGLLISNIEGITPTEVDIATSDYAMLDGGYFNSARMGVRNITIEMYYSFIPHIETARHKAYRYFPIKSKVRLDFLTDERNLMIEGRVEGNDTKIFSEQEMGQISIVCPDPYFYESTPQTYILGSSVPEFEFPFSNESLTEKLICFSDYGPYNLWTIDYQGDMEVGITITVRFKKKPTFDKLTVYDVTHNKTLVLDFEELKEKTSVVDFEEYGNIVFSSVRGHKAIYYERFGKVTNIIGAFDVQNFPWMYLTPGENVFAFDIQQAYLDEIDVVIEHKGAYGGV